MPRARNIKPGFFANEKLAELDPLARLLFAGLWTVADREGRLEDRPKRIKAQVLPYDKCDIDELLSQLEGDFIYRYEVEGEKYIAVVNWAKHQKPHHMELPSAIPPADGCSNRYNHSPISKAQRKRIIERDGGRCAYCSSDQKICIDHKIPVSKGGTSDDENLQALCAKCNGIKGNKEESEDKESCTDREQTVHEPYTNRGQVNNKPCTDRVRSVKNASCPTDSGYLIPDSGSLKPETASPALAFPPRENEFDYERKFGELWSTYPAKGRSKIEDSKRWYLEAVMPDPERIHARIMETITAGGKWAASENWAKGFIPGLSEWIRNRRWLEDPPPAGSARVDDKAESPGIAMLRRLAAGEPK